MEGTLYVNIDTDPYQYEGELNFSRIILEELAQKVVKTENSGQGFFMAGLSIGEAVPIPKISLQKDSSM